jgi:hypothetical protein
MKKTLLCLSIICVVVTVGLFVLDNTNNSDSKISDLRKQHEQFLKNSPFKETLKLSKKERKANGLPPNKYSERIWELTMNPNTGKPEPEKLFEVQEKLRKKALFAKVPGENSNDWVERGPNNVGGRTRAIMFDPNDATNKRVFAGGVSGGLWVNNDITDANSSWAEVNIPQNLAVTSITFDPNNTNIFYLGTGESYVQGDVNGNGLWKSTDAGTSWTKVFGGVTGETTFSTNAKVTVNSPVGIAGDYFALQSSYGSALTNITGNLVLVDDSSGSPNQGCNSLTNGLSIAGNIAVVERGGCDFTVKSQNAQDAGAIAVLIVNNVAGPPIVAGGTDPGTLTIPTIMISKEDGQNIIAQLGSGVNATLQSTSAAALGRYLTPGIHHINDVVVRDNAGTSEVFVAAASAFYADGSPASIFGIEDYGLYKSSDSGVSWTKIGLPLIIGGTNYSPNDIEISADNTVWLATTNNIYGAGGGTILSSSDGTSFSVATTVANGVRTQIAVSGTNANKIYVLAQLSSGTNAVEILETDDAFSSQTSLPLPNDADTDIDATDFTRGQAFYDLMLEVDPTNDNIVYTGGIDLFKSVDGGTTWGQLSHWYGGFGFQYVHADQHALAFGNNSSSTMIFANDGGVYYSSNSGTTISARNKDYNTIQFYTGAIGPDINPSERILGGAQDNANLESGTSTTSGVNSFSDIRNGGDGAYVFIDRNKSYMISSYVYNNFYYHNYNNPKNAIAFYEIVEDDTTGDFINPAGLDDINDVLYTNGTSGAAYRINRYVIGVGSATASSINHASLTSSPTAFKTSDNTSTTLFVGTETGKLLKIVNANTTPVWQDLTGPDFYGSISCIELGATDMEIYVTFYNYGVTNIFYTNDGGTTWQNKEGNFPDIPVRAIMANPLNTNEVIIGTDLGVWGTTDFSAVSPTWVQSQNGMKDVVVTSFDLRESDNTVLASTYGRGMFTGQFTADPSTLAVEDIEFKDIIKVYPTVSDGNFKIAGRNEVSEGVLSIFDLNGREVYASKINFNINRIQDISLNTSSGIYIVKFKSNNKLFTQKVIVK